MLIKLSIWQDVEEYLGRRSDVVLPIGSAEQHGPSGPIGTDTIVAEELANELGEERRTAELGEVVVQKYRTAPMPARR